MREYKGMAHLTKWFLKVGSIVTITDPTRIRVLKCEIKDILVGRKDEREYRNSQQIQMFHKTVRIPRRSTFPYHT